MSLICDWFGHKPVMIEPYWICQSRFYDCGALIKNGYVVHMPTKCSRCGYEHALTRDVVCAPGIAIGQIARTGDPE